VVTNNAGSELSHDAEQQRILVPGAVVIVQEVGYPSERGSH
jgi:hypothetical protein